MADTLTSNLRIVVNATDTKDMDLSDPKDSLSHTFYDTLASGTSSDQADLIFHDTRSLAATSEDLDVGGGLTDAFGNTLTFAKIKLIYIENNNTTDAHVLNVGGATANAISTIFGTTTDEIVVRGGGALCLFAPKTGYAITTATADILKIDAGAQTVSYDIIVIGTSA